MRKYTILRFGFYGILPVFLNSVFAVIITKPIDSIVFQLLPKEACSNVPEYLQKNFAFKYVPKCRNAHKFF